MEVVVLSWHLKAPEGRARLLTPRCKKWVRTMTADQPSPLGALLLRTRKRADLTQEALAERAGVSANTVSNLEAGRGHLPRQATLDLLVTALATALGLDPAEQAELRAACRHAVSATRALRQAGEPDHPPAPRVPPAALLLPSGALTFLVCAPLPATLPQPEYAKAWRSFVPRLATLLQQVVPSRGGRPVDPPEGPDGAVCVFARATQALEAACAVQQALWDWSDPPDAGDGADWAALPVCLALHTGWAEPGAGDYAGPCRRRAARLARLGHGGQLLLTQATRDAIDRALPEGVRLQGAGQHRLSVVERPRPLYQVAPAMLPGAFPPLRALPASPTNLPVQLTSFVGREREGAAVASLLVQAPLVTLAGMGGCGKTRLALQVAADLLEDYPDGAWLVELAPLADPALVPRAVAGALGLREEPGRPLPATLRAYLQDRRLLLLLDNCEHLLAACAELASSLLRPCPHLQLLATSRERLGIGGEQVYTVPPLAVPPADRPPAPAALLEYGGVRLFVERARADRPDFALTAENAGLVARICARLDGLPLAIELAAARAGSLPLATIAARLARSLEMLADGPRDAAPRQQALRAALDWSWDLLGEPERALLRRLSVFAGGWGAEATEAVCGGPGTDGWPLLGLLGGLVGRSLVVLQDGDGAGRYGLLETVRQYAAERLAEAAEDAAARDRHLDWCVALAEEAEPRLTGPEQGIWLARLETEHDNLRAALSWGLEGEGVAALGQRLAAALWRFWLVRGFVTEGRRWLGAAVAAGDRGPDSVAARVLAGAGVMAGHQGDYARAATLFEEALALWRLRGDREGVALALNNLGVVFRMQGDYGRAAPLFEEVLALRRALSDHQGVGLALNNLGLVAYRLGDYRRAAALHEEALALQRALGDTRRIAGSLGNLGNVAYHDGDYGRAAALHEEAMALQRSLGDTIGIATSLVNMAAAASEQADYERSAILLREGFVLGRDLGARDLLSEGLEIASWLAAVRRPRDAARLGGASEALGAALRISLPSAYRTSHDRATWTMRAALGEEAFAAAWAEGRALSLEQALALELEEGGHG